MFFGKNYSYLDVFSRKRFQKHILTYSAKITNYLDTEVKRIGNIDTILLLFSDHVLADYFA